jgi:ppGpp synthetase/RelA/SpoT-type nucleotidyltranferase
VGVPQAVATAFQAAETTVVALESHVKGTLASFAEQRDYLFRSRRKKVESLAEKLESGRYAAWSDLDDLFACTIVVPTASHEDGVIEFLDAVFDPVDIRRRNSTKKPPDVFRFDSTRYIGRVRQQVGLALTPGISDISFEVQIPTIFEHAWSVVTHDLVYKSGLFDWRAARLASQLKAGVEQTELIIAAFEANMDFVPQSSHPETDAKVLVATTFSELMAEGAISKNLEPQSWSRFAENVFALASSAIGWRKAAGLAHTWVPQLADAAKATDNITDLAAGSLFQVVVGCVARGTVPDFNLDKFVIVDSSELHDLHGVTDIPNAFAFDA